MFMSDITSKTLVPSLSLLHIATEIGSTEQSGGKNQGPHFHSHPEVATVPFLAVPSSPLKQGIHINAQKPLPESWILPGNENNAKNLLINCFGDQVLSESSSFV